MENVTELVDANNNDIRKKEYYVLKSNFIRKPLCDIPRGLDIIDAVRNTFNPTNCRQTIFIAGGFASFLEESTNRFQDVDIYTNDSDVFSTKAVTFDHEQARVRKKGILNFGEADHTPIDLIKVKRYSIESILSTFDINWSMIGIDLDTLELVVHKDFYLPDPIYNTLHTNPYRDDDITLKYMHINHLQSRIQKYAVRRHQAKIDGM